MYRSNNYRAQNCFKTLQLIKERKPFFLLGIFNNNIFYFQMLFTMRSHHMLTDVVLEVGKELFHVHKVVLAAGSPYFKVNINKFSNSILYNFVTAQGKIFYFIE